MRFVLSILIITFVLSGCAKPVVISTDFYDADSKMIGSVVSNAETFGSIEKDGIKMTVDSRSAHPTIAKKSLWDKIMENLPLIAMLGAGGAAAAK